MSDLDWIEVKCSKCGQPMQILKGHHSYYLDCGMQCDTCSIYPHSDDMGNKRTIESGVDPGWSAIEK